MSATQIDAGVPPKSVSPIFSRVAWGGCLLALLLTGMILVPLLTLLRTSVTPAGSLPFETVAVTFVNFVELFSSSDTPILLANTLIYATGAMFFALVVATAAAWLTERTDMPGRVAIRVLMMSWLAVPPLVFGYGWILLINPGNGALNALAMNLFGLSAPPFKIYSLWSLILITGIVLTPTGYIMIAGLLRNMDPQLERAGGLAGAGSFTVMRRITLPLLSPGLLSISIFMFMSVIQTFDLPAIIGMTAQIPVLSTRVYLLSSPDMGIPNYGLSAALGVMLLVLAIALVQIYFRFVGIGERFRTVSGKGFRPSRMTLGGWRYVALALLVVYVVIAILPILILAWTSLQPFYRTPSIEALSSLSLATYRRVLNLALVQRGLVNTVILVLCSATLVMALSSVVSWYCVRGRGALARYLEIICFAPTAVPPIVIVMAIMLLYLRSPIYGTVWILVLAHTTSFIAFGTRTMTGALVQLHKELGDAALMTGASWLTTLRRVIAPMVWPQILNGWIWVAAHSARDLTVPMVLMTSGNMVVSTVIWMMWDLPDLPGAAAVAMLLVAGLMAIVLPVQIFASRQLDRG